MEKRSSFELSVVLKQSESYLKDIWKKMSIDLIEEEGSVQKVIVINQKRYAGNATDSYIAGILLGMKIGDNQARGQMMGYDNSLSTGEEIG